MVRIKIIKKTTFDKKKETIISEVWEKELDDEKLIKFEKNLSWTVNKLLKNKKNNVDGVHFFRTTWEKKIYNTQDFTTDKTGKVIKFWYKWKTFESSHKHLKDVTISFRWTPSVDDPTLWHFLMNK